MYEVLADLKMHQPKFSYLETSNLEGLKLIPVLALMLKLVGSIILSYFRRLAIVIPRIFVWLLLL